MAALTEVNKSEVGQDRRVQTSDLFKFKLWPETIELELTGSPQLEQVPQVQLSCDGEMNCAAPYPSR